MTDKTAEAPKPEVPEPPASWLTVNQLLAWVAFRSCATNWDTAFYFGASDWFARSPEDVIAHLQTTIDEPPGSLFRQARSDPELAVRLRSTAAGLPRETDPALAPPAPTDDDDARAVIDHLSRQLEQARGQREKLRTAAEMARRAIASGELPAFGWRGYGPDPSAHAPIVEARVRIPAEDCAGPVMVTDAGLVPTGDGEEGLPGFQPVWSHIRFPKTEVLRLWPSSSASAEPQHPEGPEPERAPKLPESQSGRRPLFSREGLAGWYRLRVHSWPKDASPPTEAQDVADAQACFEGSVPRSAIREIRKARAPENWLKPGPRKPR